MHEHTYQKQHGSEPSRPIVTMTPPDSLSGLMSAPATARKAATRQAQVPLSQDSVLHAGDYSIFLNSADMAGGGGLDSFASQFPSDSDDTTREFCMDGLDHGWAGGDAENDGSLPEDNNNSRNILHTDSDATASIIGIVGSISRQLAELRTHSWDTNIPRVEFFDGMDNCYTGPWNFNPLERIFYATIKFVTVLQMMAPMDYLTAPPPCRPTTLPTALMLLSTYVQLGEIFDLVLTRIGNVLQQKPGEGSSSGPALSEMHSIGSDHPQAGLPGRGQISMLLQTLEHQLHLTEDLLGLPADCRLWSTKNSSVGILDQDGPCMLSEAVLHQIHETFRLLKRNIERIHSIL